MGEPTLELPIGEAVPESAARADGHVARIKSTSSHQTQIPKRYIESSWVHSSHCRCIPTDHLRALFVQCCPETHLVFSLVISIGLDPSQRQSHEICTYLWRREKRGTPVILAHLRAVDTCQARGLIIKSGVSRDDAHRMHIG